MAGSLLRFAVIRKAASMSVPDPFAFWSSLWRSGMTMAETGGKFAEMMRAATDVVDSRTRTMAAATRNPLTADYHELGRMVPEKVEAFSASARAAADDFQALQSESLAQWQAFGQIALRGRPPTAAELARLTARSARIIDRAAQAGGKALAPVHKRATANAKRLKR
jgi:hypothetical protein